MNLNPPHTRNSGYPRFITSDNGGEDLFAHFSEIRMEGFKTLKENQRVSFEVKTGPKGKQAANIQAL
ncbi:cold-shock protein [Burkholderia thailandensis]|uniref:cold-shock protein n=1 Tax=Burkholderia thailandensis TaxID=57975 RepID=UPI0012E8D0F1|nr:cold shock domain-containing protein [Burkholderia thailandensis]MUV20364.1 cold-shock protein [Burkholderia thailandensis]